MYIKVLLNFLLGYVSVIVEGFYIEKFINLCKNQGVFLARIKRKSSSIIYVNIGINDFKKIVKIAKKTKCKVKIKKKSGLPFIFHRYKKRKVFAVALGIIVITIIGLSNFIWNIEISGVEAEKKHAIQEIIENEGLCIGSMKYKVNFKNIINKVRLEREDIAWIGIEIRGTNAIVKVVEAKEKPEVIDEDEYCNIVANKDAVIMKVNAQNGTPQVKEGDVVKPGTILIAGWMEGKYTGTRYVHASGEITAKVWYNYTERVKLKEMTRKRTNLQEKKYRININNFQINLYKTLSKFQNYDTISEDKKIKLFSNFYLPIGLTIINNYEVKSEEVIYNIEEAKKIGVDRAKEELDKRINNKKEIVNTYVNTYPGEDYIDVEMIYEIQENIGTKEKIVF